ncbi:hypothetical protein A2U01_0022574, partial [Trifolium medium]|nr:hypothetical protein [Trifolium medium]
MDVARLLVRSLGTRIVDTIIKTVINGERFDVRLIEDSFGPLRVVASGKTTNINDDIEDEESDNDADEVPSLRHHGGIGVEEFNEHSLPLNGNDFNANMQEMDGFDEGRENELAIIAFKSNSNLAVGGSTNIIMRDDIQEKSSPSVEFAEQTNIPSKSIVGPNFNISLINGRASGGGVNINGSKKQVVGPNYSCGLNKPKEGLMTKPKVKSLKTILGERPHMSPSGKYPTKRTLSKPVTENHIRKGGIADVVPKSGAVPTDRSSNHDSSAQASSKFSSGYVLCCSSIKTTDII